MPSLEPILDHVLPLLMVVIRLTGLFIFTPLLSSANVPFQFRALLAFMFAVAIYPFVPPIDASATVSVAELVPLLFAELLIGVAIGLIAAIPLLAIQMGGYVMGYQIGLALAESYNPELETNGSVVGDILFYLSIFIFMAIGGMDILFATLAHSFTTAPIGMFHAGDLPLDLMLAVLASGFELAMRVAAPVMVVVSMLMIAMGFVMKTMPQINIMSIGFAAKIIAGLLMLALSIGAVGSVAGDEIMDTLELLSRWVHSLALRGVGEGAHG
ncbi:MAG: flagellar biosynthetic protein FliR [Phycisphaerales bacterium]|nr:flagellar biosynthetic protein FliR [Planctomycetota bacterium]MCH8508523.1 flagellar biosynthetic protein FliR [Phycisphaerales bacterium]